MSDTLFGRLTDALFGTDLTDDTCCGVEIEDTDEEPRAERR
jgi:hypothetical protein